MRQATWVLTGLLLAACTAATPSTQPQPSSGASQADRLLVEGDDVTQLLDPGTGTVTATLPGGVLAPSLDVIVKATSASGTTAVRGVDLGGRPVLTLALDGVYGFPNAYGDAPSGFSPNGKWLALVSRDPCTASDPRGARCLTRFAVIDIAHNTVANVVELSSRFTFDAIHNDGAAMYLVEHPVAGSTTYNVRLYDLKQKTLLPDIIFDKTSIAQYDPTVGLMDGTFHVSVAPKHGDWSFGLYMRPNGSPFVHALNVPGHYATCIVDLAGVWTASSRFSMALRDDGAKLFVVDAGMGTVSVIDADRQKVERRATFTGRPGDGDPRLTSAIVSHDGKWLYATASRGVAVLSATDLTLKTWDATDVAVRSLAVSRDGAHLYALTASGVRVIEPLSGAAGSSLVTTGSGRALHLIAAP